MPAVAPAAVDAVSTAGSPVDLLTALGGYGLVGAILLAVLFRVKIMPTYVHDDYKTDAEKRAAERDSEIDALQSELRELNSMVRERVMPALTRALDAERSRDERHRTQDRGDVR